MGDAGLKVSLGSGGVGGVYLKQVSGAELSNVDERFKMEFGLNGVLGGDCGDSGNSVLGDGLVGEEGLLVVMLEARLSFVRERASEESDMRNWWVKGIN